MQTVKTEVVKTMLPCNATHTIRLTYPNGTVNETVYKSKYNSVVWTRTNQRNGWQDPKFRQKIAEGKSATTPLDAWKSHIQGSSGQKIKLHCRVGTSNNPRQEFFIDSNLGWQPYMGGAGKPEFDYSTADNKAAIEIRRKIRDSQTKWSGLTFLGEIKESIAMLRKPAKAAREYAGDYISRVKRAKAQIARGRGSQSAKRKKVQNMIADSWLEYSFGWMPLAHDISDICEVIKAKSVPIHRRITGWAEHQTSSHFDHGWMTLCYGINEPNYVIQARVRSKRVETSYVRYTAMYEAEQRVPPVSALDKLIAYGGFDVRGAAEAAWELTPWSFLVDYFTNVGDVIQANLTSLEGVKWVNKTVRRESVQTYYVDSLSENQTVKILDQQGVLGSFVIKSSRVNRSAASIPLGNVAFELPGHRNQFLNMVALAKSRNIF